MLANSTFFSLSIEEIKRVDRQVTAKDGQVVLRLLQQPTPILLLIQVLLLVHIHKIKALSVYKL